MATTTKRNAPGPAPELRDSDRGDATSGSRRLFFRFAGTHAGRRTARPLLGAVDVAIFGLAAGATEQAQALAVGCRNVQVQSRAMKCEQPVPVSLHLWGCGSRLPPRRPGLETEWSRRAGRGWGSVSSWPCGVLVRSSLPGFTRQE